MSRIYEMVDSMMESLEEGGLIQVAAAEDELVGIILGEDNRYYILGSDWEIFTSEEMRSFLAASALISMNIEVLNKEQALKRVQSGYYLND